MLTKLKKSRTFFIGLFVGIVIASASTAFAARPVTYVPQEAKLVINGQNTADRPLVIKGTSYLPVRTVASALNFDVRWDQETSTIFITNKVAEPTVTGVE